MWWAGSPPSTSSAGAASPLPGPSGVVNFTDEEGARFGVACAGSRVITGALNPDRARALADRDGVTMRDAMRSAGHDPDHLGRDDETLARVGTFVELHVEQGRALADLGHAVGVGSDIWPHGRWRFDVPGEANHAGTTGLDDREDAMLGLAAGIIAARRAAETHGCVATVGKVHVVPGGVNAIASGASGWLDARGTDADAVLRVVSDVREVVAEFDGLMTQESWTPTTDFDPVLARRISTMLGGLPVIGTGAGHDAGILANDGIRTAMLFVRNPTGVSHSPDEWASADDCVAGVAGARRRRHRPRRGRCMTAFWCEHAVLPGGVKRSVRVVTDGGRIVDVRPDAAAEPGDVTLRGVVLPGLANAHSHAFHRALRGRTHDDGGNFWTWRDAMYAVTHRLDPETLHALAKAVFAEMLLAGYTTVGEFHYVHHAPGGRRYDDPNVMGKALLSAAREAGIRITLLDTCYLAGGLTAGGHLPLDEVQERFSDGSVDAWAARVDDLSGGDTARIGTAVHSVRAVPSDDLAAVGEFAARDGRPAARAPVGAARREPRVRRLLRLLADRAALRRGAARADDDGRARDAPLRQGRPAARRGAHDSVLLPHHRARPGRRHRPRPAPPRRGSVPRARLRPAGRHRPVRGAARRRDARAPREPGARAVRRRRPPRHGHACSATARSAGTTAGSSRRATSPTSSPCGSTARAPPGAPRTGCSTPRRRPTSATSSSTASASSPGGSTAPGTSAGCSPTPSRRSAGERRTWAHAGRVERVTSSPASASS